MLLPNELLQGGEAVKQMYPLLKRVPGEGPPGSPLAPPKQQRGLGWREGQRAIDCGHSPLSQFGIF